MEKCYTVAETVKMTGVKSYVLRYWEDELDLHIGRNELGHRYYTGEDIQLFLNIKELKNRGLQLRAIHDLLPKIARRDMSEPKGEAEASGIQLLESALPDKNKEQDEEMFKEELRESVKETEEDTKILEFQEIMERLITQELHAKKEGEGQDGVRWMKPSEDSSLPERKPPQPWINVGKRKAKRINKKRELPLWKLLRYHCPENQPSLIAPTGQASAQVPHSTLVSASITKCSSP